jgi:cytochrome c biogenesis protein CcmG/thiol:disulfide interchange protein DsbE
MKSVLRWAGIVVVVVAVAFGYVYLAEHRGYALKKGTAAPAFRLASLAGGAVDLSSKRGTIVVLNFWATWCPPCVAEMPSLERLYRTLSPEGLSVVTVSTDEDQAELRKFVAQHGLTLPVLLDPGGQIAAGDYRTTGYPETFLLDRQGRIVRHVVGPEEWDSPEMIAELRRLMGRSGGTS